MLINFPPKPIHIKFKLQLLGFESLWWADLEPMEIAPRENPDPAYIARLLINGGRIDEEHARALALSMLKGSLDEILIAAVLVALKVRGEDPSEVRGFARALRETCVKVRFNGVLLDTAGTGGDGLGTLNASTAAAIVAASMGATVAKHGNRSVSGRSGSADVMEALGYNINHGAGVAECMLKRVGFTFLFAPIYHPAMKAVMPVRRRLGVRTIFNLVGPLSNPAGAQVQVLGTPSEGVAKLIASAAEGLGYTSLLIVTGHPGIDEVSPLGSTLIIEVRGSSSEEYRVDPEDLGVKRRSLRDIQVSSPSESASRIRKAFSGHGSRADMEFIALNAGAALYAYGLTKDLRSGVEASIQALEEGRVASFLDRILAARSECHGA